MTPLQTFAATAIALVVFVPFAMLHVGGALDHLRAAFRMVGAVYFTFR